MKKPAAEFIGTFALVFFGCGAAVIAGMGTGPTAIDVLGIAFAFGLAIVAMAYGIGPISGCHVNPAVSFGVLVAGRMTVSDFISYAIAQVLVHSPEQSSFTLSSPVSRRDGAEVLDRTAGERATLVSTICSRRLSSRSLRPFCFWSAFSV
jgi:hypothetical protein